MVASLAVAAALAGPGEPTADACGWDWETYHAEARSLPCVFDALLGFWPKHTPEYHQVRIEAADQALRWIPGWAEGLDAKGISLMKLGRLERAEAVMARRHDLAPEAYPGHANLGTLYTFTGDFDRALAHIDRAMAIEPEAHFGREKYHRALVVFLRRVKADPAVATTENFLGVSLSDRQRFGGSRGTYRALGLDDDAFDALVSMLTVYGADELAEVYLTLGELLAARGHPRLAYTAYRRAKALGHPRARQLKRWMKTIDQGLSVERYGELAHDPHRPSGPLHARVLMERQRYRGIGPLYIRSRRKAKAFQSKWARWERKRLGEGLAIWTEEGLDEIYARMHDKRRRCDAPRIIADERAPLAEADGTVEGQEASVDVAAPGGAGEERGK